MPANETNDFWSKLSSEFTTTELCNPTVYEYIAAEGSFSKVLSAIPLAMQLILSKFAFINENFLHIKTNFEAEGIGTSIGYIHSNEILEKEKKNPFKWRTTEKKIIAYSNELVQKQFIVGSVIGTVGEFTKLTHIGMIIPNGIAGLVGTTAVTVLGIAITTGLISVAILQWSLVSYAAWQVHKVNRKCTLDGLLKDRLEKLQAAEGSMSDSLSEPHKQKLEKIIEKYKQEVVELAQLLQARKMDVTELLKSRTDIDLSVSPSEEKLSQLETKYEKELSKYIKQRRILLLHLSGWLVLAAVATLAVAGCFVFIPYLLPIFAACAAVSIILHLAASTINKYDKYNEYMSKKTEFYSSLELLKKDDNPSKNFIEKLISSTKDWCSFHIRVDEDSLGEYKDAYVFTNQLELYFIDKEGISHQLKIGNNSFDEIREFFKQSDELLQGKESKNLTPKELKKYIEAVTGHVYPQEKLAAQYNVAELDAVKEDEKLALCLQEYADVLPANLRRTMAFKECLGRLKALPDAGDSHLMELKGKLAIEISKEFKNPSERGTFQRAINFFKASSAEREAQRQNTDYWSGCFSANKEFLEELTAIFDEYELFIPFHLLDAFKHKVIQSPDYNNGLPAPT